MTNYLISYKWSEVLGIFSIDSHILKNLRQTKRMAKKQKWRTRSFSFDEFSLEHNKKTQKYIEGGVKGVIATEHTPTPKNWQKHNKKEKKKSR